MNPEDEAKEKTTQDKPEGQQSDPPRKKLKLKTTSKNFNLEDGESSDHPPKKPEVSYTNQTTTPNTAVNFGIPIPHNNSSLLQTLTNNNPMQYNSNFQVYIPVPFMMPVMQQQHQFNQPPMPQYQSSEITSDEYMMEHLIKNKLINMPPSVYNQPSLGQESDFNPVLHPNLQEFMDNLDEDQYNDMAEYYMESEMIQDEFMGNGSANHHTYSDMEVDDEDDQYDPYEDDGENPNTWLDPEGEKRQEEARKKIFSPDFKDCTCCKGYVSNCSNQICLNLGICFCVVRKQNEESTEQEERTFIEQNKNCECCKGFVLSCNNKECQEREVCKCSW